MKVTIDVNLHQLLILVESLRSERIHYHQMIMEDTLGRYAAKKVTVIDELIRQFEDNPNS